MLEELNSFLLYITDEEDSGVEMLKRVGDVISKSERLMKGTLNYKKCTNLNNQCRDVVSISEFVFLILQISVEAKKKHFL